MVRIGIMDSGVGGLSVFKEIRKALPAADIIYYSDNAYCPYGEKTPEFIIGRCRVIIDMMLEQGVQVVVIACNTATAAAIQALRASYSIPFVGMEPAVKPAALGTHSGVVGVLATAGTLRASKYLTTRGRFEEDARIVEHVGKGFVELVEKGLLSGPEAEAVVSQSLLPLLEEGADTVALGCTHYPFLLPVMQKVAKDAGYQDVKFIDPAPAVARQLLHVMEENGIGTDGQGTTTLRASGSIDALERTYRLIR